jgi:hypothetical protein
VIWANSYLARRRELFPFAFVAALVCMSVVVNVAHAAKGTLLGQVIAALPPLVLLGTLELVAAQHRRNAELVNVEHPAGEVHPLAAPDPESSALAAASTDGAAGETLPARPRPVRARTAKPASTPVTAAGEIVAPVDGAGPGPRPRSTSRRPIRVAAEAPVELLAGTP